METLLEAVVPLPPAGSEAANCQVFIAGSGPVGLALGCLLRKAGIDVVIADPHLQQGQASKAIGTMPRTIEVLETLGVTDEMLATGRAFKVARMSLGGGKWHGSVTGLTADVHTRFSPLALGQGYVEAPLARRFEALGGRLFRASRFVGYSEDARGVSVEVERSAYVRPPAVLPELPARLTEVKHTTFRAAYVVGCDGKNSGVRKAMGGVLSGHDYEQGFLLADMEFDDDEVRKAGWDKQVAQAVIEGTAGTFLLAFRIQGKTFRLYICCKGLEPKMQTEEFLRETFAKYFPAPGIPQGGKVTDLGFFAVSCKIVDKYRRGRCLLAGDAAHHHSPAGGQGMNTGIQDSANLAWKLSAVLKGQAGDALLDTYQKERKPIAEWVLSTSDGAFSSMTKVTSAAFSCLRATFLSAVFYCLPASQLPP